MESLREEGGIMSWGVSLRSTPPMLRMGPSLLRAEGGYVPKT